MISLIKFFIFFALFYRASCNCGNQILGTGLIFNGMFSEHGQWPWLAPFFKITGSIEEFQCGSSLISNLHVVTASHCIYPKGAEQQLETKQLLIYLGRTDFSNANENDFVTRGASEVNIHPDWNANSKKYDADIAIITMIKKVEFTAYIQPVCLPSAAQNTINMIGTVVGYGFTESTVGRRIENLSKHLNISSVTQEQCLFSHQNFHFIASERTFCAGEHGKIPCNGDSGGGFYIKNPQNSQYTIVGIVSAAIAKDRQCDPDYYAIFTNVAKFLVWIKDTTGINISKPVWYSYKNERKIRPRSVFQQEDFKAYVGRKWHESKLIVGKFMPQHNTFYLPYFSNELTFTDDDFELLEINGGYTWIPFTGTIPQNAIEGGHEGYERLLIGRKYHNNVYLIGKVTRFSKQIYVPYYGKELGFSSEFDILVDN